MAETGSESALELLVEEREGDIVVLTMNRPRAKNAVSFTMWEQFSAALDRIENGTPPRLVILCGAGDYFSTGGDVKTGPARGDGALGSAARLEMGQRIVSRIRALPVPTVAAVEGGAFGFAWGLALACDMIFTSDKARFGAPFLEFGLVPDGGAAWFLTRQLGRQRASEIIYSGRFLDAEEAYGLGLVSRIVPAGTAVEAALALGATIGHGNRKAVELTKRLLHISETSDLPSAQALELVYCVTCQAGEEVKTAREAFIARAARRARREVTSIKGRIRS